MIIRNKSFGDPAKKRPRNIVIIFVFTKKNYLNSLKIGLLIMMMFGISFPKLKQQNYQKLVI